MSERVTTEDFDLECAERDEDVPYRLWTLLARQGRVLCDIRDLLEAGGSVPGRWPTVEPQIQFAPEIDVERRTRLATLREVKRMFDEAPTLADGFARLREMIEEASR